MTETLMVVVHGKPFRCVPSIGPDLTAELRAAAATTDPDEANRVSWRFLHNTLDESSWELLGRMVGAERLTLEDFVRLAGAIDEHLQPDGTITPSSAE